MKSKRTKYESRYATPLREKDDYGEAFWTLPELYFQLELIQGFVTTETGTKEHPGLGIGPLFKQVDKNLQKSRVPNVMAAWIRKMLLANSSLGNPKDWPTKSEFKARWDKFLLPPMWIDKVRQSLDVLR